MLNCRNTQNDSIFTAEQSGISQMCGRISECGLVPVPDEDDEAGDAEVVPPELDNGATELPSVDLVVST